MPQAGWLRCFGREMRTKVIGADVDTPMQVVKPKLTGSEALPRPAGEGVRDCCVGGICAALFDAFSGQADYP